MCDAITGNEIEDVLEIGMSLLSLGWFTVQDVRRKRLRVLDLCLLFAVIVLYLLSVGRGISVILTGIIPGVAMYGVSICSREQVGKGDAILIFLLGLLFGLKRVVELLLLTFLFVFCYSVVLFIKGHGNRKKEIAFVPFLLMSQLVMGGIWMFAVRA